MDYIKRKWSTLIIFIVSAVAMSGSLYFSEVVGYIPCELCWWQRIFMYPIVFITFVSLFKKRNDIILHILPLSIIGIIISTYHIIIQFTGIDLGFCTSGGACNVKYIEWFGFITIPVLCFTAFLIINITVVTSLIKERNKSKKM